MSYGHRHGIDSGKVGQVPRLSILNGLTRCIVVLVATRILNED